MTTNRNIELAAETITKSDALLITAGAGIGVDSGLPDFRGNEGFWKAYPPMAKLGVSFYEMANPEWFQINPKLAWGFYGHRLNLYRETIPHQGFTQLFKLAKNKTAGYFVFTSNVDGQFQIAGFEENFIEECHGSIHHLQCSKPCNNEIWETDNFEIEVNAETFEAAEPFPQCKSCNSIARPNILMFGDWGWNSKRTYNQSERLDKWLSNIYMNETKLVIIEIGAGNAVATVRYKSESIANRPNVTLIRINPRDYDVPKDHISINLGGAAGIDKIYQLISN